MRRIVATVMFILLLVSISVIYSTNYLIAGNKSLDRNQVISEMNKAYSELSAMEDELIRTGRLSVSEENYSIELNVINTREDVGDVKIIQPRESTGEYNYEAFNYFEEKNLNLPKKFSTEFKSLIEVSGNQLTIDNSEGTLDNYFIEKYSDTFRIKEAEFKSISSSLSATISSSDTYLVYVDNSREYYSVLVSKEGTVPEEYYLFSNEILQVYKYPGGFRVEVLENELKSLNMVYIGEEEKKVVIDPSGDNIIYNNHIGNVKMGELGGLTNYTDLPVIVESENIYNYVEYQEVEGVQYEVEAKLKAIHNGVIITERVDNYKFSRY